MGTAGMASPLRSVGASGGNAPSLGGGSQLWRGTAWRPVHAQGWRLVLAGDAELHQALHVPPHEPRAPGSMTASGQDGPGHQVAVWKPHRFL